MITLKKLSLLVYFALVASLLNAQLPMYDDPLYHGAADPVVVYNAKQKLWFMLYTNRRATLTDSNGVRWVHHTPIGVATSRDGKSWQYKDTANIQCRFDSGYTYWAPDVIADKGTYHMYLTYVPGVFNDWNHPRSIVHCTSKDLMNWQFESKLSLANEKVIDPSVYKVNDTLWRMWYNSEPTGKNIYYAESNDLYHWQDKGVAIDNRGEGPKVFFWHNKYYLIMDEWKGMSIFSSDDLLHWTKQTNRILEEPGTSKDDQAIGGHCDVVVNNNRAFIYYFTHPGRVKGKPKPANMFDARRSVIQIRELIYKDGEISCDRNKADNIQLVAGK
ncbi:MAG: family 43 glycosylhydrolase [Chitinophagaceae bacterium]